MWGRNVVGVVVVLALLVCVVSASSSSNTFKGEASAQLQAPRPLPNFDWFRLRKYLFYAWACYQPNPQIIANWTCCWCNASVPHVTVTHMTEGHGTQGAFGYVGFNTENEIVVSFRGAVTLENWIEVFQFWMDRYPYVKDGFVEHGFWTYWQSVQKEVVGEVKALQAKFPNYTVICTGHSLGASLSVLAAIDLVRAGIKNVEVWNYGQPRAGNPAFANYAAEMIPSIVRVTNHADIAPEIPPRIVGDYHHAPTEVWFGIPGNFQNWTVCSRTDGEDNKCINSVDPLHLNINDHNTYLGYIGAPC